MKNVIISAAIAIPLLMSGTALSMAEEFSVVGSWSGLPLHKKYEAPFWNKMLPEASGGTITTKLTTFDQMGVKGGDVFRLLSDGVFDIGMTVGDYTVGDAPELEGLDVPLIATTAEEAKAMVDAARPMVADIMANRFNAELLAIAPYPPQIVFCREKVTSIEDLKGRKIRGSGRMTTKFLEALGAEGINLAFSEVPGALERGVVDCAVTGAGSGYSSGWWEVSKYLVTLPLGGWDPVITAMNLDKWNSLDAKTQSFLRKEIETKFEKPAWDNAASSYAEEIACLTGRGKCTLGKVADMKLVAPSKADVAKARDILITSVLPDWAKRAGGDWAERWNKSVGAVAGVTIDTK